MRANVFLGLNQFGIREIARPHAGVGEAIVRMTLTTLCGTDLHIMRGELVVAPGRVIGHEFVGVIDELGAGITGYRIGDRVLVGAITPCGQCGACLSGHLSQCGGGSDGYAAAGGWSLGNTIDGSQAEYVRVPFAQANLARIPDELTDEQVILLADIASTGFAGAEAAVHLGDAVVVFAQGPIGLCATIGARLLGAALVIGIDGDDSRLAMARRMGADVVIDHRHADVVAEVKRLTGGGVDVAIEALGTQQTLVDALRCLRPGGTLSSLGVYSGKLQLPADAFAAGLGGHKIVTTLCPGGKERMRRLVQLVRSKRIDLLPLLTHSFSLDNIGEAYELFGQRGDGVVKIAIRP